MNSEMYTLLQDIYDEVEHMLGMGKVADYIPALASVNPRQSGIVAVVPGRFSICVFSPALNSVGNSRLGVAALTSLSERINWSIY